MAIRVPSVTHSSRILRKFSSRDIPKGHLAVYVGQKKRYVSHPWFQDLLSQAQEEFDRFQSFHGWSHNSLHRRCLCSSHFWLSSQRTVKTAIISLNLHTCSESIPGEKTCMIVPAGHFAVYACCRKLKEAICGHKIILEQTIWKPESSK